jgi:hypothetical protein
LTPAGQSWPAAQCSRNFAAISQCNFDVEARFADHGKLNLAWRAPISATRLTLEDAAVVGHGLAEPRAMEK